MSEKRSVVIDCDPGIDDALALFLAMSRKDWNILGICGVAGNVSVENTALNAVKLCSLAGKNIPVYSGASCPLYRERKHAESVHGADGLGGIFLDASYSLEKERALDFLLRMSQEHDGRLDIITLGPMTNLAHALMADPGFAQRIRSLTFMGGAMNGGNASPAAEFNIYADPEAARVVLKSGIPLYMIGLDVTNRAVLENSVIHEWQQSGSRVTRACGEMLAHYKGFYDGISAPGVAMHDPLAVAALINPALITYEAFYVDVEIRSSLSRGKTVVDRFNTLKKEANVQVALEFDNDRFMKLLTEAIESYV